MEWPALFQGDATLQTSYGNDKLSILTQICRTETRGPPTPVRGHMGAEASLQRVYIARNNCEARSEVRTAFYETGQSFEIVKASREPVVMKKIG